MNTLARALTVLALFGAGALTGLWIGNTADHSPAAQCLEPLLHRILFAPRGG